MRCVYRWKAVGPDHNGGNPLALIQLSVKGTDRLSLAAPEISFAVPSLPVNDRTQKRDISPFHHIYGEAHCIHCRPASSCDLLASRRSLATGRDRSHALMCRWTTPPLLHRMCHSAAILCPKG
jgi:hypothetical protein